MSPLKILLCSLLLLLGCFGGSNHIVASYIPGIPNICMLPPPRAEGICTIEIEGFYYDPATLDCQMYSIGACRLKPGQSFGSQQDCVATCVRGLRRDATRRSPDYYKNE